MADAILLRPQSPHLINMQAAAAAGELRQGSDGRAYFLSSSRGAASSDVNVKFTDNGQVTITKTAGICFLDGGRVFWDRSARAAHFKQVDDQDFYVGTAVGDAGSADTTMTVKLNVQQSRKIELARDPFSTSITGTQALGGLALNRRGGALNFVISTVNEVQKLDALSKDGFGIGANAIVEFAWNVINDGAGTVVDVSMGVASGTHATDADSIANHLFIHLDANSTVIKAQSASTGKTPVAATDTTKTYTEGAGNANRKEVWFDFRNPADVQVYVEGVNVLPASIFDLSGATTLYLLQHIEKTAAADAYEFDNEWAFARTAEQ